MSKVCLGHKSRIWFCRSVIHKSPVLEGWAVPFMGSDRSVVLRSQRYLYEKEKKRPLQVQTYVTFSSLFYVVIAAFFGAIFGVLAKFQFGRNLLLKVRWLFNI